jgi:hypothetical protein
MKRVALYIRVSTSKQDTENQRRDPVADRFSELVGVPRRLRCFSVVFSVRCGKNDPDEERGAHGEDNVPRCLYEPKLPVSRHPVNMRRWQSTYQPGTLP